MERICEAMKEVRKYFVKSDKVEYRIVRTKEPYMFLLHIRTPRIEYHYQYTLSLDETVETLKLKILSDFINYITR